MYNVQKKYVSVKKNMLRFIIPLLSSCMSPFLTLPTVLLPSSTVKWHLVSSDKLKEMVTEYNQNVYPDWLPKSCYYMMGEIRKEPVAFFSFKECTPNYEPIATYLCTNKEALTFYEAHNNLWSDFYKQFQVLPYIPNVLLDEDFRHYCETMNLYLENSKPTRISKRSRLAKFIKRIWSQKKDDNVNKNVKKKKKKKQVDKQVVNEFDNIQYYDQEALETMYLTEINAADI